MIMRNTLVPAMFITLISVAGFSQTVDELVAKNIAARGGTEAWKHVTALKTTGYMDIGAPSLVPYELEQKRPDKMRLEYVFNEQTVVQTFNGKEGWKLRPYLNKMTPDPMTEQEVLAMKDTSDLYGLLIDYKARGHSIELLGREKVEGKDAYKLKVTLPKGTVRWVYLDAETGIEVKMEATRIVAKKEQRIETFYREWKDAGGLIFPSRQETRTAGEKELHPLTVQAVEVNPQIDDARFGKPSASSLIQTGKN